MQETLNLMFAIGYCAVVAVSLVGGYILSKRATKYQRLWTISQRYIQQLEANKAPKAIEEAINNLRQYFERIEMFSEEVVEQHLKELEAIQSYVELFCLAEEESPFETSEG